MESAQCKCCTTATENGGEGEVKKSEIVVTHISLEKALEKKISEEKPDGPKKKEEEINEPEKKDEVAKETEKNEVVVKATEKKDAAKATEKKDAAKATEKKDAAKATEKKDVAKESDKKEKKPTTKNDDLSKKKNETLGKASETKYENKAMVTSPLASFFTDWDKFTSKQKQDIESFVRDKANQLTSMSDREKNRRITRRESKRRYKRRRKERKRIEALKNMEESKNSPEKSTNSPEESVNSPKEKNMEPVQKSKVPVLIDTKTVQEITLKEETPGDVLTKGSNSAKGKNDNMNAKLSFGVTSGYIGRYPRQPFFRRNPSSYRSRRWPMNSRWDSNPWASTVQRSAQQMPVEHLMKQMEQFIKTVTSFPPSIVPSLDRNRIQHDRDMSGGIKRFNTLPTPTTGFYEGTSRLSNQYRMSNYGTLHRQMEKEPFHQQKPQPHHTNSQNHYKTETLSGVATSSRYQDKSTTGQRTSPYHTLGHSTSSQISRPMRSTASRWQDRLINYTEQLPETKRFSYSTYKR